MNKINKHSDWVDISMAVKKGMIQWPGDPVFRMGRCQKIEHGDSSNVSFIKMPLHIGTHIEAPLHYFKNGPSLDKMPLGGAIGRARVLEIKDKESVKAEELKSFGIKTGERLLFKTANSKRLDRAFSKKFVYISPDAARYLSLKRPRCVGIDYISVGAYEEDGIETHRILLDARVLIIEGLNLKNVPAGEYDLVCLPLKILEAEASPARAIIRPLKIDLTRK